MSVTMLQQDGTSRTAPTVTVLIPAYNAASTIRRAIDSVFAQSYQDYEVIVVDDGSRDTTSDVVASYSDERIRLLKLAQNCGESGAMNEGIAAARGELVAFLDADDEWLPQKLSKQVEALQKQPAMIMATCGCRFTDAEGTVYREFGMPPAGLDENKVWRSLLSGSFIAKPCVVARTSALRTVGPFDTALAIAADQDMWIRLAMAGPVAFIHEYLTIVHDTPGSLTRVYATKADKYVLPMIMRHITAQRHQLSDAEVQQILGARYTSVGRNLYLTGSLVRGTRLIMRAVAKDHLVQENLWYLAAASPPAKAVKRLVGHPASKRKAVGAVQPLAANDGVLIAPHERAFAVVPPGPPILIVMIDAEAEFDWNGPFLRSHMSVRNMSQQALAQDIFDRLGVRPTYLVDYAVATQSEGFGPLREFLQSDLCEIGSHLQPWENPPFSEELSVQTSFNTNLPAWLQKEKLLRLTDAIVSTFGIRPSSYRAGRYGVGEEIAWILDALDYQIDLSVLPGHDLRRRHGPDFRRSSNRPYWFGPGQKLLEIPLTTGFSGLLSSGREPQSANATLYSALSGPAGTRLHLPGIFARLGLLERITLSPEGMSIEELKRLTRLLVRRGQHVFTFNYHSSALLPGYTPYVRSQTELDGLIRTIEEYLHFFMGEIGGISMTPMQFLSHVRPPARKVTQAHSRVNSLVT